MKRFLAIFALLLLLPASALALSTEETGLAETGTRVYGGPAENIGTYVGESVITPLFSLLGIIFLVLMIYGGLLWMLGGGNETTVSKAKRILSSALVGLLVILIAYGFTVFVFESLTSSQALQ